MRVAEAGRGAEPTCVAVRRPQHTVAVAAGVHGRAVVGESVDGDPREIRPGDNRPVPAGGDRVDARAAPTAVDRRPVRAVVHRLPQSLVCGAGVQTRDLPPVSRRCRPVRPRRAATSGRRRASDGVRCRSCRRARHPTSSGGPHSCSARTTLGYRAPRAGAGPDDAGGERGAEDLARAKHGEPEELRRTGERPHVTRSPRRRHRDGHRRPPPAGRRASRRPGRHRSPPDRLAALLPRAWRRAADDRAR